MDPSTQSHQNGTGNTAGVIVNSGSTVASNGNDDGQSHLSAAQRLQKQHESVPVVVEDQSSIVTEDPFPPINLNPTLVSAAPAKKAQPINLSDESAFPSLSMGAGKKAGGMWGGGNGSGLTRVKQGSASASNSNGVSANVSRSATPAGSTAGDEGVAPGVPRPIIFTERVLLPSSDIHVHSYGPASRNKGSLREAEPTTLAEVMKLIMRKYSSVTVEASTSRNVTTFILKGKSVGTKNGQDEVSAAKRELLGRLAKKVSIELPVPASLRGFIVGAKGKTLKTITDSTGAMVQIPPRESDAPLDGGADDLEDGPLISINISGDAAAVAAAKAQILLIVSERAAKVTAKIDTIPRDYWSLLAGVNGSLMVALVDQLGLADAATVNVPRYSTKGKNEEGSAITVTGERDAVSTVVKAILAAYEQLRSTSKTLSVNINKPQHRFLIGANADEILELCGCSIELPAAGDDSESVTIRGPQSNLVQALGLVMEKANATPIVTLDLTNAHGGSYDRKLYASSVCRFIHRKSKFRNLARDNSVEVFLPEPSAIERGSPLIEIVGSPEGAAGAKAEIITIVRALPPSRFMIVHVDSLLHRHLSTGKTGTKIKAYEKRGAEMILPPEGEDRSDILLAFSGAETEAEATLTELRAEIQSIVKEAADITSVTISIPKQFHSAINGQKGTTLNAIIGEDMLVNVTFGSKSKGSEGAEDQIMIRGTPNEIARVQKEIERIAAEAKDSDVTNSYVAEFEIDQVHVRHIVGKAGTSVNKLRETLGVSVDFEELAAEPTSKSVRQRVARSKVTIRGRKENVEEAKKRILSQGDKLADETTLIITLPASFDRGSLIGKQGVYLKRLETTYDVRINFPKDGKKSNGEGVEKTNPNEITIRGGKRGAESAKKELVDLMDYEKENGNTVTFAVSTKSLPRILGKAGAQINEIKDETSTTIDIDQEGDASTAGVTVRGTKTGIAKAKLLILAIAAEVDDEAILTVEIPKTLHTTLIGSGGASIRDLISRCGGPSDARLSGNAVRFPKQGESADTVTIRATKAVATKIKAALESEVAALQSRVTWAVAVPSTHHASIIGKAAAALQDVQKKHGVKIVMPGWKEYEGAGIPVNSDDIKDANEKDIVKIVGPREAAIAAAEEISKGRAMKPTFTQTVEVPRKHHGHVAQGGRFFRSLPKGTRVTHGDHKTPSSNPKAPPPAPAAVAATPSARIDDDGDAPGQSEVTFSVVELAAGSVEDGEIPWIIESATPEDLDRVVKDIERTLRLASEATHLAYITVPKGLMPRIVGRGGAGLEKLRGAAGVEVEVAGRRDSNLILITGSLAKVESAHQMILELESRPARN